MSSLERWIAGLRLRLRACPALCTIVRDRLSDWIRRRTLGSHPKASRAGSHSVLGRTCHPAFLEHSLRQLPSALKAANVEVLVVDTAYAYIELAALSLGLPYVQIWLVLNFDTSGDTPPNLFDWPHENTPQARERNLEGVRKVSEYFLAPSMPIARAFAEQSGLTIDLSDPASSVSNLAVISQTPQAFDYPNIPWFRSSTTQVPSLRR
jgi:hypothetical protein